MLATPTPEPAEAQRELLRIAVRRLGVAAERDLRDFFRLSAADAKPRIAELVEAGELLEGHALPDHVHLLLSVPPKFSVANTVGLLKGKSAIRIHREYLGRQRNFTGYHFWARGYCVSTVGLDEVTIRSYIRHQESEEKKQERLEFGGA